MTRTATVNPALVDWAKGNGLVPAIVQDARSLRVLMLGYMNEDALKATQDTGLVTFFSRSKGRLWQKGETSGHGLKARAIRLDCDADTLLIMADPLGPTCHKGTTSCFGDAEGPGLSQIADLAATIRARRASGAADSYTAQLLQEGLPRIAQKVGEEGVEVALAAVTAPDTLAGEAADLLYHWLVLMEAAGQDWFSALEVLYKRAQKGAGAPPS